MTTMHANGVRSWVPTTFLSMTSRPPFLPVDVWADRLSEQLSTLHADPSANPGLLAECFNQSALLQTIVGDNEAARSICLGHIEWAMRLAHRNGDQGLLAYALQPWVNLGRLHLREKHAAQALEHFRLAVSYDMRRTTALGPCTISGDAWDAVARVADPLPQFLWTVFVVDSYKAYAVLRDFGSATDLLRLQRRMAPVGVSGLLDEAEALSLLAQDRFTEAAEVCDRADPTSVQEIFANLEYHMACDIGRRAIGQASADGLTLGVLLRSKAFARVPPVGQIELLTALGRMLRAIGDDGSAAATFQHGLEIADMCCDERSIVTLSSLLAQCRGNNIEHRGNGRPAVPTNSWYARSTARAEAGPMAPPREVRRLHAQVINTLDDELRID